MKTLTVKPKLTDQEIKDLEGKFLDESYIDILLEEDTNI